MSKEYQKQYYLKNKENRIAYKKAYYQANIEKYKIDNKARYQKRKDKYNAMTEQERKQVDRKAYNKEYYQKRKLKELEECIEKTKGNK